MFDQLCKFANLYSLAAKGFKASSLPQEFWVKFVEMSKRLKVSPYELAIVINSESGFNPGAQNIQGGRIIAQGLNQLIKSTAKSLGITDELWENFSKLPWEEHLKWSEKFFARFGSRIAGKNAGDIYLMNFGGFSNPDGSLYASKAFQEKYKAQHPEAEYKQPNYQQKAIEQNSGLVDESGRIMPQRIRESTRRGVPQSIRAQIDEAIKATEGKPLPAFEEPNPNWTGTQAQQIPVQTPVTPNTMDQTPYAGLENILWFN